MNDCTDEIIDIIKDSLHYPLFEKAHNNLSNFEKDNLYKLIYQIVENTIDGVFLDGHTEGYDDCKEEMNRQKEKDAKNEDG